MSALKVAYKAQKIPNYQKVWKDQIEKLICSNLNDHNWGIPELAKSLNISERQFHRRVKNLFGITPNRLIQMHRLNKARLLLEEGQYSTIAEVAFSVGYRRSDYFSNLFGRHFGHRPIVYFRYDPSVEPLNIQEIGTNGRITVKDVKNMRSGSK